MSLTIFRDGDDIVSICCNDTDSVLSGFIDIYVDDDDIPSPFKTQEDAELFAKIIVKLLEKIT